MIIVGITGQIASGKSTVSNIIKKMGYQVFEADKINKTVLNKRKIKKKLKEEFQLKVKNLFFDDNRLNTGELAKYVFSKKSELIKLENITHPIIYREELKFIKRNSLLRKKIIFLDVPLLFRNDNYKRCDFVIYLNVNGIIQKQRLRKRKKMDNNMIKKIIDIQKLNDLKFNRHISIKLNTGQNLLDVTRKIKKFIQSIKNKKIKKKWPVVYYNKIK